MCKVCKGAFSFLLLGVLGLGLVVVLVCVCVMVCDCYFDGRVNTCGWRSEMLFLFVSTHMTFLFFQSSNCGAWFSRLTATAEVFGLNVRHVSGYNARDERKRS